MIEIAISGARGRMGQALLTQIELDPELHAIGALERDRRSSGDLRPDVVIDFSSPSGARDAANYCAEHSVPLLVGTTGLDAAALEAIERAARVAAVIVAPNTSVGVHVLLHLASRAAQLLGPDFDAEILEMHHRRKVDAPSGTALALARAVGEAKGISESSFTFGRSGRPGARPAAELGVLALRGGDVIGEHTIYFAGEGERIELTHRAHDRSLFARGALRAAKWLAKERTRKGSFSMADALDLG